MRSSDVPEGASKRCLICLDVEPEPILWWFELPPDASIAEALRRARQRLEDEHIDARIDWEQAPAGIWGVRQPHSAVPRDGDRIEVYRPLAADPRVRRRQRARTK